MRIGIIGGGASGLFAACQLKRLNGGKAADITLIERNPAPGKKLLLTGHGRCNITNRKDIPELKKGYHEAENFIYPALKEYGPEDVIAFFENELGLPVKEEDNNRIFPVCDSALKVRDAILSYLSGSAQIVCGAKVTGIKKTDGFEVLTSSESYIFDRLILSCGGSSFSKTGSSGDSYLFAESLGHTIVPAKAALAPVAADAASRKITGALSGVSVTAKVSVRSTGKTFSKTGEILFADFGLTGPAVMEISREIPVDVNGQDVFIELDLVPSLADEQFDAKFQELIRDHADAKITTLLSNYVPSSLAGMIAGLSDVKDSYAQNFSRENRKKILRNIKHLKIGLDKAPDIDKAYVTRGGVSLKEVDRKTMQSKIAPGLYIIGEALDIDGISGGYNLQACMSEACLASKSILS